MKRHRISMALVLSAATIVLTAQIEVPDWENSVRFELVASQHPVRPGDAFQVAVIADIEEGYHLYGPEEMEPSRTEIAVSGEHLEIGDAVFPPVITRDLEGLGTYELYEGKIAIRVPVKLGDDAPTGEHEVRATVHYQVCTDFACSAPTSDELSMRVPGDGVGAKVKALHPEIFSPN